MPAEISPAKPSRAVKEAFSGPANLLTLAKSVASPDGEKGLWSAYVCAAIEEKLKRDGHWPTSDAPLRAELLALAEDIGLPAALDTLRARARRAA
jgi:hypothetical protein